MLFRDINNNIVEIKSAYFNTHREYYKNIMKIKNIIHISKDYNTKQKLLDIINR